MEAQLLRTFVAVARLRSFSAAAAELGYTQAAVSQQIAALENDLKTQLLTRRPVTPTEPGARLLEHAEPILLRLDAAKADVTRMTKTPPDELDLALTDGLTAPGDPLPEQAPVTAIGLSEEQISVVLPAGHPLAARTTLRLEDLADARWIEAGNVAPPLAEIRRHAGVEGFRPALRYLGEDVMTLINLAAAGHGLTLLPESMLRGAGITAVRVTQPRVGHRVELLRAALPEHSPAAALAGILTQR